MPVASPVARYRSRPSPSPRPPPPAVERRLPARFSPCFTPAEAPARARKRVPACPSVKARCACVRRLKAGQLIQQAQCSQCLVSCQPSSLRATYLGFLVIKLSYKLCNPQFSVIQDTWQKLQKPYLDVFRCSSTSKVSIRMCMTLFCEGRRRCARIA